MSTNASVLGTAAGAINTATTFNVAEVRAAAKLDTPAIGNYTAKYFITFTREDGTVFNVQYDTSAHRNTAWTNFLSAFSTAFT